MWIKVSEREIHDAYDQFLNEINPKVKINGLEYDPADVFKRVDPTAYRCGFNDWLDGESDFMEDEAGDYFRGEKY